MADINFNNATVTNDELDLDLYPESRDFAEVPPKGRYTVQAPSTFPPVKANNSGNLSAQIDPTIVGPTGEGTTIKFDRVSAKVFRRRDGNASQLGDYLKACGVGGKLDSSNEEAINEKLAQTANAVYQVDVDWRAYRKRADGTSFVVEGMERFPLGKDGRPRPWIDDKDEIQKDENGVELKKDDGSPRYAVARANLVVTRRLPA